MAKRKDVRDLLRPQLERLGATCTRLTERDSLGFTYETWVIRTGAGRLEIYPQDSWAPKGKRKRFAGHIHARFDDPWLGGVFMGDADQGYHTGKWNHYAVSASPDDSRFLVDYFVAQLERVIAWQPRPCDLARAEQWKAAYDLRWGRTA